MTTKKQVFVFTIVLILSITFFVFNSNSKTESSTDIYLTKIVDVATDNLKFYWKDENGKIIHSFENLKKHVSQKDETLIFATNGGMFHPNFSPVGLYIEDGKKLSNLNTNDGKGNFHMKPNGVFYITKDNTPNIKTTPDFQKADLEDIKYATQSGPMLLINGNFHPKFNKSSTSKHYRNGVGLLPNNQLLFVMSTQKVNLYNFANYFKEAGCDDALYLDGFVSKTYLPEKNWTKQDGKFGVLIGVTQKNQD